MNPRKMNHMMKKLGITQVDIPATEVIIRCEDKDLIIRNPQVSKVNMMGQMTYQIVGEAEETTHDTAPDISEDDIKTVMSQAGVDKATAKKAIEETSGDLAEAIMKLTQG